MQSFVQRTNNELCHLCVIATRLNREIKWDPTAERIVGDDWAASFAFRKQHIGFELPNVD